MKKAIFLRVMAYSMMAVLSCRIVAAAGPPKKIGFIHWIGNYGEDYADGSRVTSAFPVEISVQPLMVSDVFYTVDGTEPTLKSTPLTNHLTFETNALLRAIAYSPDRSVSVSGTLEIAIDPELYPEVRFRLLNEAHQNKNTLIGGNVFLAGGGEAAIESSFEGGHLFYTLDGSAPSSNSTPFTAAIQVTNSATLRAIGYSSDFSRSATSQVSLSVSGVSFLLYPDGTYGGQGFVTNRAEIGNPATFSVSSPFFRTQVFYTLDGSEPTRFSAPAEFGEVRVAQSGLLRVIAYNTNFTAYVTGELEVVRVPSFLLQIETNRLPSLALVGMTASTGLYRSNQVATLTAAERDGWLFGGWRITPGAGSAENTNPAISLVMSSNRSVFPLYATHITTATDTGGGRVDAPQEALFGDLIRVRAVPDPGFMFAGWRGAVTGETNPATLLIQQPNPVVKAAFTPAGETGEVTLSLISDNSELLRVDPPRMSFVRGEIARITVTLAATNNNQPVESAYRFSGWSGDAGGADNPLEVLMDRDKTIRANVEAAYPMQQLLGGNPFVALPAIAEDGTVYVGWSSLLYSLSPDFGRTNWVIGSYSNQIPFIGRIIIGDSGNIYAITVDDDVLCVSPRGEVLWKFVSGNQNYDGYWQRPAALTSDDTLYFSSTGPSNLVYVVKNGALIRTLPARQVPVIGPDDTLYFPDPDGFSAQTADGTVKWTANVPQPQAIDAGGRLYSIASGNVAALDFNGKEQWRTAVPPDSTGILLGENGRVFVSSGAGLTVLDTNGAILWTNDTAGPFAPLSDGGAVVLKDEGVYGNYYSSFGLYNRGSFVRILPNGKEGEISTYNSLGFGRISTTPGDPLMNEAGDLYVRWPASPPPPGSNDQTRQFHWRTETGVAESSWPSPYGRRNTRRAIRPGTAPRLALVKNGNGWVIQRMAGGGDATLESSSDLQTWHEMGPLGAGVTVTPGDQAQLYYRARKN